MGLEAVQVAHPVLDELWADQLAARVPQVAVGAKDAVTEEVVRVVVECLPLAKVGELGRQHGLDVVGLRRQNQRRAHDVRLGRVRPGVLKVQLP